MDASHFSNDFVVLREVLPIDFDIVLQAQHPILDKSLERTLPLETHADYIIGLQFG